MAYENAEMYRIEMNNKIGAVGVNGKFYLYLKKNSVSQWNVENI